ncbi:hypothetical protein [Legionella sp. PC997]|uniref:hypothetical protein n=1 Tax=Legionella sp. PC997 TaxID=2755562 RepID=UPI0015F90FF8|nr:hypothetical protein [Legionella sp. PC997]QMT59828.1 hypothetical protein HBNCFIEN_01197 [Legionella sp. PC997]
MRNLFQWIVEFLDAIVGVEEHKPNKRYLNVCETQEQYEAGLIRIGEYNKRAAPKEKV